MEPMEGCRAPSYKGFTPGTGHLVDRYRGCCARNWVLERTPGMAFRDLEPQSKATRGMEGRHQNPETGMAVMRNLARAERATCPGLLHRQEAWSFPRHPSSNRKLASSQTWRGLSRAGLLQQASHTPSSLVIGGQAAVSDLASLLPGTY